jgi:crossover junction endodeoxyribonuclease RuvC
LIVLGVDPGLVITGYGVLSEEGGAIRLIEAGIVDSGDPKDMLSVRLCRLYKELEGIVAGLQPDVMALEQLYSHYAHPRTAILMGHARGVICLIAGMHEIPLNHYAATRVKSALTGNGRASKEQIQQMVKRTFGLVTTPDPPDVADAIAIALCHLYHRRTDSVERELQRLK